MQLTPLVGQHATPDGFGGTSALPDHSIFGGQDPVVMTFSFGGGNNTQITDELSKKKK